MTTTSTMTAAQAEYERFWRLAQETYRAETSKDAIAGNGYYNALSFLVRAAVRETIEECITIARQMRANTIRESHIDFYYDGYVAGCDRALNILQGRE